MAAQLARDRHALGTDATRCASLAIKLSLLVLKLRAKGETSLSAATLWSRIVCRTDLIYVALEDLLPAFKQTVQALVDTIDGGVDVSHL